MCMKLAELRAFVAVVETGSVNRAAARLHQTQPAVSRQVQRLEGTLGTALLDRRTKPPTATPAGHLVLDHARRILIGIAELKASVSREQGPVGEFRLGFTHTLVSVVMNARFDKFRRMFPKVTLRLKSGWTGSLIDDARRGTVDAVVGPLLADIEPPKELRARCIGTDRLLVVAAKDSVAFEPSKRVPLKELAQVSWVVNPEGCSYRNGLRSALTRANVPFNIALEVSGPVLHLALVARGFGLGLVPRKLFQLSEHRPKLAVIRVSQLNFGIRHWFVTGAVPDALKPVAAAVEDIIVVAIGSI